MPSYRHAKGVLVGSAPAADHRAHGCVGLMLDAIAQTDVGVAAYFAADVRAAKPRVVAIGRSIERPEAGVHRITAAHRRHPETGDLAAQCGRKRLAPGAEKHARASGEPMHVSYRQPGAAALIGQSVMRRPRPDPRLASRAIQ